MSSALIGQRQGGQDRTGQGGGEARTRFLALVTRRYPTSTTRLVSSPVLSTLSVNIAAGAGDGDQPQDSVHVLCITVLHCTVVSTDALSLAAAAQT